MLSDNSLKIILLIVRDQSFHNSVHSLCHLVTRPNVHVPSPKSLCIIHRKALCAVMQKSGGDVIAAVSVASDCNLDSCDRRKELSSALLRMPTATAEGRGTG